MWIMPSNPGPTLIPHNPELTVSVIDLVFWSDSFEAPPQPVVLTDRRGPSDHVPISSRVRISAGDLQVTRHVVPRDSEEEGAFIAEVVTNLGRVDTQDLSTGDRIEAAAQAVADVFASAWTNHAKPVTITSRSKSWWTEQCGTALAEHRRTGDRRDWKNFLRTTRKAKRDFFDERIREIATTNRRPWDLMAWVKQRKLPPCEAIQYRGEPCHTMESLWEALHGTYNSASGRACDLSILDEFPQKDILDWVPFSHKEMMDALKACSSRSAPGPDHVTWTHLKGILPGDDASKVLLAIANACTEVGYWPSCFKESVSVIIPKPGKPSYSVPKAFRPIVLLNTLGKLIEKMISNRLQFDGVKYGLFHPMQLGGIRARSTEDAGLFLTHLVKSGWVKGLKTSVVAFDIAQFFPSLNHDMLLAIIDKLGLPPSLGRFFASYLVGRSTSYLWGLFSSPQFQADVGVGQGSALSPVLSALYLAPLLRIFELRARHLGIDVMSYVNDGTLIAQSKHYEDSVRRLAEAYGIIFRLFEAFGLVLEHNKSEVYHFSRAHQDSNPSIDLGFVPFTGNM